MEAVKTSIKASLLKEFGPGSILELDTTDRCIKIELPVSCDHVIYVRPDDYEKHFLCHYAHKLDLEAVEEDAGDVQTPQQLFALIQSVSPLPGRRVPPPVRRRRDLEGQQGRGLRTRPSCRPCRCSSLRTSCRYPSWRK